jgi:hypothetical protein
MTIAELLTKANWKNAILQAIDELPEELQASIGSASKSDDAMTVTVAVKPIPTNNERQSKPRVTKVEVIYWRSMRDLGWPPVDNARYGPGGTHEEQADWPIISIERVPEGIRKGLHPGHAYVTSFRGELQLTILEKMYSGGGESMVFKDANGRFVRKDGSKILDWQ